MDSSNSPDRSDTTSRPQVWGPWATFGFGVAILSAFLLAQAVTGAVYVFISLLDNPDLNLQKLAAEAEINGLLITIGAAAGFAAGTPLVLLFAWLRQRSFPSAYLGFTPVSGRTALACIALINLTAMFEVVLCLSLETGA